MITKVSIEGHQRFAGSSMGQSPSSRGLCDERSRTRYELCHKVGAPVSRRCRIQPAVFRRVPREESPSRPKLTSEFVKAFESPSRKGDARLISAAPRLPGAGADLGPRVRQPPILPLMRGRTVKIAARWLPQGGMAATQQVASFPLTRESLPVDGNASFPIGGVLRRYPVRAQRRMPPSSDSCARLGSSTARAS